jgi:hypothetical protein
MTACRRRTGGRRRGCPRSPRRRPSRRARTDDPRVLHLHDAPHRLGDGREDLGGRAFLGHQRLDAPQRRLLVREEAELVTAGLDHPVGGSQLGLDTPPVGHVPADALHEATLHHGPRVPLEPANRAVGADDAVLEPDDVLPLQQTGVHVADGLLVVRSKKRSSSLSSCGADG